MPQFFAHQFEVAGGLQQVGGVGMAQAVRAGAFVCFGRFQGIRKNLLYAAFRIVVSGRAFKQPDAGLAGRCVTQRCRSDCFFAPENGPTHTKVSRAIFSVISMGLEPMTP